MTRSRRPAPQSPRPRRTQRPDGPRHGIARVLSKRGLASRTQAAAWVHEGRVRVNGAVVRDPEFPVDGARDRIEVEGREATPAARMVLMLNKPRGLVTTASDERGRDTVYACFEGADLPWLAPVGRLDRASEGLLLFTNDPAWAARITDPATGPTKTYHVQANCVPDAALLAQLEAGVEDRGEQLRVQHGRVLRAGARHAWLELVLSEGRNRHLRRLLAACGVDVLRLVRVSIGSLALGSLAKGRWRALEPAEADALVGADATARHAARGLAGK